MGADTAATGMQALRQADLDRYLATLYAPAEKRDALVTLYLFNAEIAAIRERIREPLPGEIRIQWWRDALNAGAEESAGHPLAQALIAVIAAFNLPLPAFDRYLDARIFDLYDDPMPGRTDLEGYCGDTASAVIQLSALILDAAAAPRFAAAAGHAGCVTAIAGIVRMMPLHRRRGQCYVPADILAASGIDREAFLAGDSLQAARAVEAMIALGYEHAARFEAEARGMPQALRAAFLPAALGMAYLDAASKAGFDPLTQMADISTLRRHWLLLRKAGCGWG